MAFLAGVVPFCQGKGRPFWQGPLVACILFLVFLWKTQSHFVNDRSFWQRPVEGRQVFLAKTCVRRHGGHFRDLPGRRLQAWVPSSSACDRLLLPPHECSRLSSNRCWKILLWMQATFPLLPTFSLTIVTRPTYPSLAYTCPLHFPSKTNYPHFHPASFNSSRASMSQTPSSTGHPWGEVLLARKVWDLWTRFQLHLFGKMFLGHWKALGCCHPKSGHCCCCCCLVVSSSFGKRKMQQLFHQSPFDKDSDQKDFAFPSSSRSCGLAQPRYPPAFCWAAGWPPLDKVPGAYWSSPGFFWPGGPFPFLFPPPPLHHLLDLLDFHSSLPLFLFLLLSLFFFFLFFLLLFLLFLLLLLFFFLFLQPQSFFFSFPGQSFCLHPVPSGLCGGARPRRLSLVVVAIMLLFFPIPFAKGLILGSRAVQVELASQSPFDKSLGAKLKKALWTRSQDLS